MALEGSIEDFGLPEIFQMILLQKKDGVLTLTREKTNLLVKFHQGQIIFAGEEEGDAPLADMLIKAERIDADRLKAVLREQKKSHRPLPEILIEIGCVTPEEVKKGHRVLTEESVFPLFEWKNGFYQFVAEETSFRSEWVEPLNTEFILMEGVRRVDEWPRLKKKVSSPEMVFEPVRQRQIAESKEEESAAPGEETFEGIGVPATEEEEEGAWLLSWIDGKRTVQEIIDHAGRGTFPVYHALGALLDGGKITAKEVVPLDQKGNRQSVSFKALSRRQGAIRFFLNGAVIVGTLLGPFLLFQSASSSLSRAARPIFHNDPLRRTIERDYLHFALDLYYLRHGRYPDSLQPLRSEGFLRSEREEEIDLARWRYQSQGTAFTLTSLGPEEASPQNIDR